MNLSEIAQAKALRKEAEALKKEWENCADECRKIYMCIGVEVYNLSKAGEIEVPQINNYMTKMDEIGTKGDELIKLIKERGFLMQKKQGHYELITIKDDKLNDTIICTCGAKVSRNSKFCSSCGKKVEELIAEPSKAEQAPANDTIICTCGAEVSKNSKFCSSCGKKVEELIAEMSKAEQTPVKDTIICTCGAEVNRNSKFCSSCGKKVEELIAEPSKAEQVSVKECICGAKIQPGQFMCLECGRKIE